MLGVAPTSQNLVLGGEPGLAAGVHAQCHVDTQAVFADVDVLDVTDLQTFVDHLGVVDPGTGGGVHKGR